MAGRSGTEARCVLPREIHVLAESTFHPASIEDGAALEREMNEVVGRLAARNVLTSGIFTLEATDLATAHCKAQYGLAAEAVLRACRSHGVRPRPDLGAEALESVKALAEPGCSRMVNDVAQKLVSVPNPVAARASLTGSTQQAAMQGATRSRAEIEHFVADLRRSRREAWGGRLRWVGGAAAGAFLAKLPDLVAWVLAHPLRLP